MEFSLARIQGRLQRTLEATIPGTLSALVRRARRAQGVARVQAVGRQVASQVQTRFPRLAELWDAARRALALRHVGADATGQHDEDALAALVTQLVSAPEWGQRAQAASALAARADHAASSPEVVAAVIGALRDPSAEVAVCAADALGTLAAPRGLAALRSVLENEQGFFSPLTRAAAVRGLARSASDAQLSVVFEHVRDVDAEVSLTAIATIVERAREASAFHLLPVLRDRSGYFVADVRRAAARGLRRAGTLTPGLLAELLAAEPDAEVLQALSD